MTHRCARSDGKSLDAWRGYKNEAVPKGWVVENGTLAKHDRVADIVSKDEFGNFELMIDWKIGEAGNSGIFYRGTEEYDKIYWSAPEYQLLDDIKGADNKSRLTCAGAAYAIYPSPEGHLKPIGDWNRTRIVARGSHIEHWLNGTKVASQEEFYQRLWQGSVDQDVQIVVQRDRGFEAITVRPTDRYRLFRTTGR